MRGINVERHGEFCVGCDARHSTCLDAELVRPRSICIYPASGEDCSLRALMDSAHNWKTALAWVNQIGVVRLLPFHNRQSDFAAVQQDVNVLAKAQGEGHDGHRGHIGTTGGKN